MTTQVAWAPTNLNVGAVMAPKGETLTLGAHKEALIERLEALRVAPEVLADLARTYLDEQGLPVSSRPTMAEVVEAVEDAGLLGLALATPEAPYPVPQADNPQALALLKREREVKNPAARLEKWLAAVTAPLSASE